MCFANRSSLIVIYTAPLQQRGKGEKSVALLTVIHCSVADLEEWILTTNGPYLELAKRAIKKIGTRALWVTMMNK